MIRRTALIALALAATAGCGVRGPLYLPEEKPAAVPESQASPESPAEPREQDKPAGKKPGDDAGAP